MTGYMWFHSAHLSATARCGCVSDGTVHLEEAKQAVRRRSTIERHRDGTLGRTDGSGKLAQAQPASRPPIWTGRLAPGSNSFDHPGGNCPSYELCQPSGGRTTQNTTPLFSPSCLGAQTRAPPSGATTLLILSLGTGVHSPSTLTS